MDFINELILLRKKNGKTQKDVADHLNIARSTYNDIEHRRIKLSVEDFIKLCEFYNVSPNFIINTSNETNILLTDDDLMVLNQVQKIINKINNQVTKPYIVNRKTTQDETVNQ